MLEGALRRALEALLGERVRFAEPLARHTSLRVGGRVLALGRPADFAELRGLIQLCRQNDLPFFLLGRGFNTLVRDGGINGVAIQLGALRQLEGDGVNAVQAGAGVSHTALTRFCADCALSGLEFGIGIPGNVGGWLAMNAGIPKREMRDVVSHVEVYDPATDERHLLTQEALQWHYRALELTPNAVVLGARFLLAASDTETIRAEMRAHLDQRRHSQPIDVPTCGSVFKNPRGDHAGRLIDAAGLRGSRAGGAQISDLHANFIITTGSARAVDVLTLIERARSRVQHEFGIVLETEVKIVGEDEDG